MMTGNEINIFKEYYTDGDHCSCIPSASSPDRRETLRIKPIMPTIFHKDGYRVFFFSNEGNEPPHVHIEYGGGYAKFWFNPIELSVSLRLTSRQLSKLRNLVEENQELFNESWHEYFN